MNQANTISLSHWLNSDTPSYGNQGGFTRNLISSIKEGRTANSESWSFNNHIGTHIDFPKHFFEKGKTSSDFQNPFFIFNKVGFIELSPEPMPGSVIFTKDIEAGWWCLKVCACACHRPCCCECGCLLVVCCVCCVCFC